ncbi:hypothetical protein KLP28_12925 [Nocardioidaceae bacterium]|nr:hypothetical protein KLP28_12925 [Nocardioidaceae bacterium]
MALSESESDLVVLVNQANDDADLVDNLFADIDPDDFRLAEILLEELLRRYGVHRKANGDRIRDVASEVCRYVVPFLVELSHTAPAERRGVSQLKVTDLERLPRILAGDLVLPAATVAGDRLGRRAASAIWLSVDDATRLCGRDAVADATSAGDLEVHPDVRTGQPLILAADLRRAGLLTEPETAHGLKRNTATNVLRDLRYAIDRARPPLTTCDLQAIEPLGPRRKRQQKPVPSPLDLRQVRQLAASLSPLHQVCLWMGRLLGFRVGEEFGLHVFDYSRDGEGRPWLDVTAQGGRVTQHRDPDTGRLLTVHSRIGTKTAAGTRLVPLPMLLGDLIDDLVAVFHTDPATGKVDYTARLIPGIGNDDSSGQSSYRSALQAATGDQCPPRLRASRARGVFIVSRRSTSAARATS